MKLHPALLDLYCGAGGAAMGYHRAGFRVVGVDIEPQPNYPFKFVQADAVEYAEMHGREFDAIHASPPCQRYCAPTQYNGNREDYPDLVAPTRNVLTATGLPWVIENVPGSPLESPAILCGAMFSLRVYRHRLFETNWPIIAPNHPKHVGKCARNGVIPPPDGLFTVTGGKHSKAWTRAAACAMDVGWMKSVREVCESIPPAYTEFVGLQLQAALP